MSLAEFKEKMAMSLFGMTKTEAHKKGICVKCKLPIKDFTLTERDEKEYNISGLCPKCFSDSVALE